MKSTKCEASEALLIGAFIVLVINMLSICSSLNVENYVAHLFRATDKSVLFNVLTFTFRNSGP
jgi:hypothetical protein